MRRFTPVTEATSCDNCGDPVPASPTDGSYAVPLGRRSADLDVLPAHDRAGPVRCRRCPVPRRSARSPHGLNERGMVRPVRAHRIELGFDPRASHAGAPRKGASEVPDRPPWGLVGCSDRCSANT